MNCSAKNRTFKKIRYFGFGFGIGRNKKGMFRWFLVSAEIKKAFRSYLQCATIPLKSFLIFLEIKNMHLGMYFSNSMEKLTSYLGRFSISFEKSMFYTEILTQKVKLWISSLVLLLK